MTGADGRTMAALNVSAAAPRVSLEELRERLLPALRSTGDAISAAMKRSGASAPGVR